jgi:glycosyltransferase involved in cell wall biosynthesis
MSDHTRAGRAVPIVAPAGIVSGKEIVSHALADGLRARGWEPRFMTSVWGNGEFPRRLDAAGFAYERVPLGFISMSMRRDVSRMTRGQLARWPELVRDYRRIVRTTQPKAVIHTNWHHALLLLPFLKRGRDIYWAHEFVPDNKRYALFFRLLAARVRRIVCVSQAIERNLLVLGVPRNQLMVIHNGCDANGAPAQPPSGGSLRIGIVGQIVSWKGHEDLLDAVALLAKKGVACELSIFGSGPPAFIGELKRRVRLLDLEDSVRWRGFVADRAEIYADIDVCAAPSRDPEPFGMSALEAGVFGRPVVCTASGGLTEIVEDGRTGIVVEPARPDRLAEALETFARDRTLLGTMGAAGRQRAQAEFSLAKFVDRFVRLLEAESVPQ